MKIQDIRLTEWRQFDDGEYRELHIDMEDPIAYFGIVFKRGAAVKELIERLRDCAMILADGPTVENKRDD